MEISKILTSKYTPQLKASPKENKYNPSFCKENQELSNNATNGISQVNTNLPISYVKLEDISIPGAKEKASLYKLANGQKIVIFPKKGPTYIKTTYNVGSLNEKDEERGISHFIEHNLFNGSKDIAPKEYDRQISDMGGYTNASTSYNKTDYFLTLQLLDDKSLEEAIKLNANLTQYPLFMSEQLEKEKEPVKSEIDMCNDSPETIATNSVLKNLFNIQTNSQDFIIGTKENINSLTREKVLDYFNTWYTPDNAVTVITGDVDPEETINLVSKYFNKKNDYSKVAQRQYEPLSYIDKTVRQDIIMKNSSCSAIDMGFAIPEGTSQKETDTVNMLLSILSSNNSRLTKALDKYGLSLSSGILGIQNKPDSAKAIFLSVYPNESQIEDVLKILYEEINYIANNPPTEEELNTEKNKTKKAINETAETSLRVNESLTELILSGKNGNYYNECLKNTDSITPEDISNAAKKFLDLNKTAICVSHSKDATNETINQNYNNCHSSSENSQISFGAKSSPASNVEKETNEIEQYKLQNNIQTMIIPGTSNSQSSLNINFKTSGLNDVPQSAFSILNIMLSRGSEFKDFDTFNEITYKNDMYQTASSCRNETLFSCGFYPENMQKSLSLLKETILHPNFSQEEFDRAKSLAKIQISETQPEAYDKVIKELCPDVKSLSSNKEEQLQEIEALTLDDIKNLYSKIISNSKVSAALTAPVEENPELKNIFNNELSKDFQMFKPFTTDHSSDYYIYKPNTEAKTFTESIENSQASVSQIYTYKDSENIDDIAKIDLLSEILGGGMSSRLFLDLREDKKLAYHTGSNIANINDIGLITLDIQTTTESPDPKEGSPENINKALEGFQHNVDLLKTQNVSDEELNRAKAALKTEILNSFETNLDKKYLFDSISDSKYGISYYKKKLEAIDKITPDDIRAAANYVFQNPPITSIDASEKTLNALNLK